MQPLVQCGLPDMAHPEVMTASLGAPGTSSTRLKGLACWKLTLGIMQVPNLYNCTNLLVCLLPVMSYVEVSEADIWLTSMEIILSPNSSDSKNFGFEPTEKFLVPEWLSIFSLTCLLSSLPWPNLDSYKAQPPRKALSCPHFQKEQRRKICIKRHSDRKNLEGGV